MKREAPFCPSVLSLSFLILAGCGDATLSKADSQEVWNLTHTHLHDTHVDAFLRDNTDIPETFSWPCPDGGSIEMRATFNSETGRSLSDLDDLLHDFRGCSKEGVVLDGTTHYIDVVRCDNGGFKFGIEGDLEISGEEEASCTITGVEDCAPPTGSLCGHDF